MQIPSQPIVTVLILFEIQFWRYISFTASNGFLLAHPMFVKLLAIWLIPKPLPPASTLMSTLLVFEYVFAYSSTKGFTPLEPTHEIMVEWLHGTANAQTKPTAAAPTKVYKEIFGVG